MHSNSYSSRSDSADNQDLLLLAGKAAAIAGGIGLAYEVFKHRRLLTTLAVCAGTAMWVKRCLDSSSCASRSRNVGNLHLGSPSFPGENVSRSFQEPMDEIDEAMMESFPASDPPASYRR
jgi:hypothetical protein